MQRITSYQYAEVIGRAREAIPPFILSKIEYADFFTGTDPVWAGLHPYVTVDAQHGGEAKYSEIPHCCYPWNQINLPKSLRRTTIVLPILPTKWDVLHELGHVLDEILGWRHYVQPVSEYALTNRYEAFACAFEAWFSQGYSDYEALIANDPATVALFERLAIGEAT